MVNWMCQSDEFETAQLVLEVELVCVTAALQLCSPSGCLLVSLLILSFYGGSLTWDTGPVCS